MRPSHSPDSLATVRELYDVLDEEYRDAPYADAEKASLADKHLYYGRYLDPEWRDYFVHTVFPPLAEGLDHLDIPSSLPMRVLDLGCGLGNQSFMFARLGARVVGIDIREESIALCEKRRAYLEERMGVQLDVEFRQCDFTQVRPSDFDEKFDAVFSMSAFSYIQPLERTVENILALLEERSRIYLYEENSACLFSFLKDSQGVPPPRQVRRTFEEAGFRSRRLRGACVFPRRFWGNRWIARHLVRPLNGVLRNSLKLSFNYVLAMER